MTSYNRMEARKKIMDHYSNPRNKVDNIDGGDEFFSKSCADELNLKLTWKDDILVNAKFSGKGCAIFIASTDIMLCLIKGKSKTEIQKILTEYKKMVNQEEEYNASILGDLIIFNNVKSHLNRLECAELIANGFQ